VHNRYLNVLRTSFLVGDVSPYAGFRNGANAADVIASTPHAGQLRPEPREFTSQFVRCESFELRRDMRGSQSRVGLHKQVHVVRHNFQPVNFGFQFLSLLVQEFPQSLVNLADQYRLPILRAPNKVVLERVNGTRADSVSSVHHVCSVNQKLEICKATNRGAVFLCSLKRAVPCSFNLWDSRREVGVSEIVALE
jgi:hypothetical protein